MIKVKPKQKVMDYLIIILIDFAIQRANCTMMGNQKLKNHFQYYDNEYFIQAQLSSVIQMVDKIIHKPKPKGSN